MRRYRVTAPFALLGFLAAITIAACSKADAAASREAPGAPANGPATRTSGAVASDSLSDSALVARADRGRLLGRDSGAVWVVMISDFQCPYCKQFHDGAIASITRDYVNNGQVRLAYINLPLPQHKHARVESEAALCAGVQNKFWPYAEALFNRQAQIGSMPSVEPVLDTIARSLSLDLSEFGKCRQRNAIKMLVESDIAQASKAGVRSTPTFLVGDFLVEGAMPYPDFRRAIDTALVLAHLPKKTR